MIELLLYDFTFFVDERGVITSSDADKLTLELVRRSLVLPIASQLQKPFVVAQSMIDSFGAEIVNAPSVEQDSGEVDY